MWRVCEWCGKHFKARPSRVRQGRGRFCSPKCCGLSRRRRIRCTCEQCGRVRQVCPSRVRRFCSDRCRSQARRKQVRLYCQQCGKVFYRKPSAVAVGGGRYHSIECRGIASRKLAVRGYVFCEDDQGRWRGKHRMVAEQMIGRSLRRGETVHHVNGQRDDNRPENLRVFASRSKHMAWHRAQSRLCRVLSQRVGSLETAAAG